jgi:hypothetical protein
MSTPQTTQRRRSNSGPGPITDTVALVALVVVAGLLLYALWAFWPTKGALIAKSGSKTIHFLGIKRLISTEHLLFVIVAVSGALGGLMHTARSFAWYVGHRDLKWRWVPYYLLMPALGAGCATLFYLVIRGGFFGGQASTADVNPYSFAAFAGLVGLFTEQALVMLRRVADEVFAKAPQGSDTVPEQPPVPLATTGAASDVAATTATLTGTLDPRGASTTFYFEYGLTPDYGARTDETRADGTAGAAQVASPIASLTAGTAYHFRLVAQNAAGEVKGDDGTFTTTNAP